MSRDYELAFILNPEVSEEETRAILERIEQIVANHGGQIVQVKQWGRRRLAYPIERHRDGFYIFIDMILTPETVDELSRTLRVTETVLRYMTKKRDPKAAQRERDARAAAAAAAESKAAEAQQAQQEQEQAQPAEAEAKAEVTEESAEAPAVSDAEQADVPPTVEESVEA